MVIEHLERRTLLAAAGALLVAAGCGGGSTDGAESEDSAGGEEVAAEVIEPTTPLRVEAAAGVARLSGPTGELELGEATGARIVHLFDLDGPGFAELPRTEPDLGELEGASQPAALIGVDLERGGVASTRLVLVSLGEPPRVLWSFVASERYARGGGLSTHGLRMSRPREGEPLEIFIQGTSVPAPGDRPFRPGPPQTFHFRLGAEGTYERAR